MSHQVQLSVVHEFELHFHDYDFSRAQGGPGWACTPNDGPISQCESFVSGIETHGPPGRVTV